MKVNTDKLQKLALADLIELRKELSTKFSYTIFPGILNLIDAKDKPEPEEKTLYIAVDQEIYKREKDKLLRDYFID